MKPCRFAGETVDKAGIETECLVSVLNSVLR